MNEFLGLIILIAVVIIGIWGWVNFEMWLEQPSEHEKKMDKYDQDMKKMIREAELLVIKENREKKESSKPEIIKLLKEKKKKIPVSDIDAFLKINNLEITKKACKELYNEGEINFAGNGRYFIIDEEENKDTSTNTTNTDDIEKDLKKLKDLLDKGLIEQEEYKSKKKELLDRI